MHDSASSTKTETHHEEKSGKPKAAAQRPSVGRVVHYHPPNDSLGRKNQPYPAVITHVFGDDCVNLEVMGDGSFGQPARHPTSVSRSDEPTPGCWNWPPFVAPGK